MTRVRNSCEPSQCTWSIVSIHSNISLCLFRALFSVKEVRIVSARVKINFWKRRKINGCVRAPKTVSRKNTREMFSMRILSILSIFYRHSRPVEVKATRFLEIWFLRFKSRSPRRESRTYVCLLRTAKVFSRRHSFIKMHHLAWLSRINLRKNIRCVSLQYTSSKKESVLNFTSRYDIS